MKRKNITMVYSGIIKMIELTAADIPLRLETDISMEISGEEVVFRFNYDKIDGSQQAVYIFNTLGDRIDGLAVWGFQIVDLGRQGFILHFSLLEDCEAENGRMFLCTAKFDQRLPICGFVKRLEYYFDYAD